MKITAINSNIYKAKTTPISFKGNNNDISKPTQFEKNLKPLTSVPVKENFFSKLAKGVKEFFEPNAQSTISASTLGVFY